MKGRRGPGRRWDVASVGVLLVSIDPCSSRASTWPLSAEDASSLRQVVLVHRHGARFPTKPTGKADIAWPIRTQFWESYKGHLTPVGSSQLQDKCFFASAVLVGWSVGSPKCTELWLQDGNRSGQAQQTGTLLK